MIIPDYAVLSLFSPAPELQGPREEGSGFGQLLTEVEHPRIHPLDQEAGERRALESVLQVLMTMFQAFTPAQPVQAVSTPGAGETGVVTIPPAGGAVLELPCGLVPTPGLEATAGANLPLGLVTDASLGSEQPTFPVVDGQSPEPSSTPTVLQENTQDVGRLLLVHPMLIRAERQADAGATADRVLLQAVPNSELPQMAIATPGERDRLTPEMVPQGQQSAVQAVESSNPTPASALVDGRAPLLQRPQQPIVSAIPDRGPLEFQPTQEQARPMTTSLLREDGTLQSSSAASQPSSWGTVPAAPGMIHAAAPPLAEAPVTLLVLPQTDAAANAGDDSPGLRSMVIAEAKAAFPARDQAPSSRRVPESEEHALESMSSMLHLPADHALSSSLTGVRSPVSAAASDTLVLLPSYPLEDMTGPRQWPRPLPANTVLLHLEPRELGALLVQVHVSEKRLSASFRAESPEAEALLRTYLPTLQESLSQQGFVVQPITITQAAEEFSTHLGTGTGAFAQQHSAFQAFTQDRHPAGTAETQSEVEIQRTPRWPAEQRARLLDVVI